MPYRNSVARIGRSYPRAPASLPDAPGALRLPRRYRVLAGLIGVTSALGLIGWLLAR